MNTVNAIETIETIETATTTSLSNVTDTSALDARTYQVHPYDGPDSVPAHNSATHWAATATFREIKGPNARAKLPSKCAILPVVNGAELLSMLGSNPNALGAVVNYVTESVRLRFKDIVEAAGVSGIPYIPESELLSAAVLERIYIAQLSAAAKERAASAKLSADDINIWFSSELESALLISIAAKQGCTELDSISEVLAAKIAIVLDRFKAQFITLCTTRTQLTIANLEALKRAIDLIMTDSANSVNSVTAQIIAKIEKAIEAQKPKEDLDLSDMI